MDNQEVPRRSRKDMLKVYHNIHLKALIACEINLARFASRKDDEVIAQIPVETPGVPTPTLKNVTVKNGKMNEQRLWEQHSDILKIIDELIAKEK